MKKLTLLILATMFLLFGCGKVILVSIDNNADNGSYISMQTEDLSTVSGDNENRFEDFGKMPLESLQDIAAGMLRKNQQIPAELIQALADKKAEAEQEAEVVTPVTPDEPAVIETDEYIQVNINQNDPVIWINPSFRNKFVLPKTGPEYGEAFVVEFETGYKMDVPNSSNNVNTGEGRGYRSGVDSGTPTIKTVEIYADPGDTSKWVRIYIK